MVRLKHKLSEPPPAPERGVKAATFRLLLDTAMDIIRQSGHIPSVAEARITRSTSGTNSARRYGPPAPRSWWSRTPAAPSTR